MNSNSLIEPLCLPQLSGATRTPDLPCLKALRQQAAADRTLRSYFIRHDILEYVESGVEIKATLRGRFPVGNFFDAKTSTTKIMLAKKDLHRNSCCFKQYLNDILNEILSGKSRQRDSVHPRQPVSARISDFLTRSPDKWP